MTSTTGRVIPVVKFENVNLPGAKGPVSEKLHNCMESVRKGDDDKFTHWLFEIK